MTRVDSGRPDLAVQDKAAGCASRSYRPNSYDPGGRKYRPGHDKLTASERLQRLFDAGTFVELEAGRLHRATGFGMEARRPAGDGVIAGWGEVYGRTVFAYAQDARVFGGSLGEAHAEKIHKVIDLAESTGCPLVALNDGGGARIQEGILALAGFGGVFRRNVRCSGVIPQISVILGPCAGGAAYSPALSDFVFVVDDISQMYITGPDVVRAVTGEDVSHDELGGVDVHTAQSGVATMRSADEDTCLEEVRYLLSLLPANRAELPPEVVPEDSPDRLTDRLADLVPADLRFPYDMRDVLAEVVDEGELFEIQEHWARNIICALARLGGQVVGLVGNQPTVLAGALDIAASEKAARFVQMCDSFNIPLVTFVDVPGFLPGTDQEHGGIIRHGAKLLYAYCNATVPRIQLVLRKAYGGAYIVMDSRSIGSDLSFAWPTNQIAVMGAEGAVNVIFRREISQSADAEAVASRRASEYRRQLMHSRVAAEHGLVDDIIAPGETRRVLIRSLRMLRTKQAAWCARKHGNQPT